MADIWELPFLFKKSPFFNELFKIKLNVKEANKSVVSYKTQLSLQVK